MKLMVMPLTRHSLGTLWMSQVKKMFTKCTLRRRKFLSISNLTQDTNAKLWSLTSETKFVSTAKELQN